MLGELDLFFGHIPLLVRPGDDDVIFFRHVQSLALVLGSIKRYLYLIAAVSRLDQARRLGPDLGDELVILCRFSLDKELSHRDDLGASGHSIIVYSIFYYRVFAVQRRNELRAVLRIRSRCNQLRHVDGLAFVVAVHMVRDGLFRPVVPDDIVSFGNVKRASGKLLRVKRDLNLVAAIAGYCLCAADDFEHFIFFRRLTLLNKL